LQFFSGICPTFKVRDKFTKIFKKRWEIGCIFRQEMKMTEFELRKQFFVEFGNDFLKADKKLGQ
jgi:hypothetical protein